MTSARLQQKNQTDHVIAMAASNLARKVSDDSLCSSSQDIEIPSWAVPARGECILEPVCDLTHLHNPVDLTTQAVFHIGRSDASDLQLLHSASSRRHAILFHHTNGNCYVVDCGSAHGTFINGVRVNNAISNNQVIPQRVRKGALLRFGGPGAPSFILKSFSVALDSLVKKYDSIKPMLNTHVVEDASKVKCSSDLSMEALVSLNTRLNSVASMSSIFPKSSSVNFASQLDTVHPQKRKMSFADDEKEGVPTKKMKTAKSDYQSPDDTADTPSFALVSPIRSGKPVLSFDIGEVNRPIVSPNPFDEASRVLKGNLSILKGCLTAPLELPPVSKKKKSVGFSSEPPQIFFAPSVTPESSSDNEE
jgi:hypothetical protein